MIAPQNVVDASVDYDHNVKNVILDFIWTKRFALISALQQDLIRILSRINV